MNDTIDYRNAHLAWLKSTRDFEPKYPADYKSASYLEVMESLYTNPEVTQSFAKTCFISDRRWYIDSKRISKQIEKEVLKSIGEVSNLWFVTIGFNHQTWTIPKCVKVIEKILQMDWINAAKANFELFRENGEHPHVHFLINTSLPKSKILEKLFRPKYVTEIVLSKNFIDVKPAETVHKKYIKMEKQESKMKYVDMDIQWRSKNNIPDYEKNVSVLQLDIL